MIYSFLLGAATVFAFAPHRLWWLALLTVAWQFVRSLRAPSVKAAAGRGFAFGLGLFGVGVSWVYIALNTFGKMPAALAGFATLLFCAYLALFPLLAAALARWCAPRLGERFAPFFAAAFFVAFEWLRGILFTGFPWLSLDHPHAGDSPLLGFAPLVSGVGVSLIAATLSALIAWAWPRGMVFSVKNSCAVGILIAVALVAGQQLARTDWSEPTKNPPLPISLAQGNIEQDLKFDPAQLLQNAAVFDALRARAKGTLVILPETTYTTVLQPNVSEPLIARLQGETHARGGALLFGAPVRGADGGIFNAALALDGRTVTQYSKQHLVPFGEYMPLRSVLGWFYDNVAIPLAGFTAGAASQPPLRLAGETLGLSICYEDVFARVVRPQALEATLLVNLTNDAWYGQSWAAEQHAQIAQMRAAEFARPLVRATNTGLTTVVDHHGREIARLPWFTRAVLETTVQGRTGLTPALAIGDLPVLLVVLAMCGIAIALRLQRK
jgi:apolipoprotein N-acyltransferase